MTGDLLASAEARMTVYSLHPFAEDNLIPEDLKGRPRLRGYPILKARVITDEAERRQIAASVRDAFGDEFQWTCVFSPRHAITVTSPAQMTTILICFTCGEAEVWERTGREANATFFKEPRPLLDAALKGR